MSLTQHKDMFVKHNRLVSVQKSLHPRFDPLSRLQAFFDDWVTLAGNVTAVAWSPSTIRPTQNFRGCQACIGPTFSLPPPSMLFNNNNSSDGDGSAIQEPPDPKACLDDHHYPI